MMRSLKNQRLHTEKTLKIALLLVEDLKVLVDDRHCKKNTGSRSHGTQEISKHGKCTDTHSTESGSSGNVTIQRTHKRFSSMSFHEHLLITKLSCNISRGGSGHFDPSLREQSARSEDECEVEHCVERIRHDFGSTTRR